MCWAGLLSLINVYGQGVNDMSDSKFKFKKGDHVKYGPDEPIMGWSLEGQFAGVVSHCEVCEAGVKVWYISGGWDLEGDLELVEEDV